MKEKKGFIATFAIVFMCIVVFGVLFIISIDRGDIMLNDKKLFCQGKKGVIEFEYNRTIGNYETEVKTKINCSKFIPVEKTTINDNINNVIKNFEDLNFSQIEVKWQE